MSDVTETSETGTGDTSTGEDTRALAVALDGVVQSVPGVVGLVAAQPTLLRAAKESVAVLTGSPVQEARVSVKHAKGSTVVEANISVADELAAPTVAAAVHQAILHALPQSDPSDERSVTVRVIDVVPSGSQD